MKNATSSPKRGWGLTTLPMGVKPHILSVMLHLIPSPVMTIQLDLGVTHPIEI